MSVPAEIESVWSYPRPPRVEPCRHHIVVRFGDRTIADSRRTLRVLETSHPPNYYVSAEDIEGTCLVASDRTTICEWKGQASYYTVQVEGFQAVNAAWHYPEPAAGYEVLAGYVAFYAGSPAECTVDGEVVTPEQPGYYGGWMTSGINMGR